MIYLFFLKRMISQAYFPVELWKIFIFGEYYLNFFNPDLQEAPE